MLFAFKEDTQVYATQGMPRNLKDPSIKIRYEELFVDRKQPARVSNDLGSFLARKEEHSLPLLDFALT